MTRTHMILSLIVGLILVTAAAAQENETPTLTSPDAVFDLGLHARSVALGSAGDIVNEDAMSVFQNPAALTTPSRTSTTISRLLLSATISRTA